MRLAHAPMIAAAALTLLASCTTTNPDSNERRLYALNPRRAQAAYDRLQHPAEADAALEKYDSSQVLSGEVTKAQLLEYALEHHPKVLAAHLEWGSAIRAIGASRRQADAMLSWSESLHPFEKINRRFMLEQHFFNPWKLDAREGQANVMAGRKRIAFYEVSEEVEREIAIAYIELQARQERVAVLKDLVATLKGVEELIEANIATSQTTQAQLLRAQVEREQLESQVEQEGLRLRALLAQLAESVGVQGELQVTTSALEKEIPDAEARRSELYSGVLSHPMIALQNSLVLLEDEKLKEAEAERLPDYTLAIEYAVSGERDGILTDNSMDAMMIRAGITIPWHFGVYDAKEESISIQRDAEKRKADAVLLNLIRRLEDQIFQIQDARREATLYQESVLPKARQTLELTMNDFAVGRSRLIDVLDAERAVLGSELALIRIRQAAAKAQSEVAYLSGHDLSQPNTNKEPE